MTATLSLLDLIERPSILDVGRGEGACERTGAADDGCDHQRVLRPQVGRERSDRALHPSANVGGAPTLDDLLTGIWETITSDQPATCPLCQGVLEPRYSAGSAPVGGRCTTCGTEVS